MPHKTDMPSFRCLIAECCFAVVEVLLKKVTTITTTTATATAAAAAAAVFQLLDGTNTSCIRRDELSVVALPSHLVATPFFLPGCDANTSQFLDDGDSRIV